MGAPGLGAFRRLSKTVPILKRFSQAPFGAGSERPWGKAMDGPCDPALAAEPREISAKPFRENREKVTAVGGSGRGRVSRNEDPSRGRAAPLVRFVHVKKGAFQSFDKNWSPTAIPRVGPFGQRPWGDSSEVERTVERMSSYSAKFLWWGSGATVCVLTISEAQIFNSQFGGYEFQRENWQFLWFKNLQNFLRN